MDNFTRLGFDIVFTLTVIGNLYFAYQLNKYFPALEKGDKKLKQGFLIYMALFLLGSFATVVIIILQHPVEFSKLLDGPGLTGFAMGVIFTVVCINLPDILGFNSKKKDKKKR